MTHNIKYFEPIQGHIFSDGKLQLVTTQYLVVFDDGSGIEVFTEHFSTIDCSPGKQRTSFKKNNTIEQANALLKALLLSNGLTETLLNGNISNIVLVNAVAKKMTITTID